MTRWAVRMLAMAWMSATLIDAAAQDILVGQTIALTGSTAQHGQAVVKGIEAYFARVNEKGGIHGRRLVLRTLDDGGDAGRAADNTARLIDREHVLFLFSGIEGDPCAASLRVASERNVPVIGCAAGSPAMREPYNRLSIPVRAPHLSEFVKLVDISLQYGYRRIAFLHSDSDNGRLHLANVRRLLRERGEELALAVAVGKDTDPAQVADRLVAQGVQSLFNHGGYGFYAKVVREVHKRAPGMLFLAVNSGAQQMVETLGKEAQGIIFTQVVPNPWGATPPIVVEYRERYAAKFPREPFSFSSLEGYVNAAVLVEALRRVRGLNADGIVAAFETMRAAQIGGLPVAYAPGRHTGLTFIDTVVVSAQGGFVH